MQRPTKFFLNVLTTATIVCLAVACGCTAIKSPFPKKKDKDKPAALSIPDSVQRSLANGETMLVGDHIRFGNTQDVEVFGFGLVKGLAGTGAAERDSVDRGMVLRDMQRRGVPNTQAILQSNTTAVVRLTAVIPAGAQIGDTVDVELILPPDSDATSLRGGWLMETSLQDAAILEGKFIEGRGVAAVMGPVFIDPKVISSGNPADLKRGIVVGGAVIRQPRIVHINIRKESQSVFIAERIAREINSRFYLPNQNNRGVATAKDDSLVALEVAPMYTRNVERYLRVIRSIALYDNPAKRLARLETLKKEVADPATAEKAVYQLEAIGAASIPILRAALQNQDGRIRAHAAIALAYLNDRSVASVLADIARDEPSFRDAAIDALTVVQDDLDAEDSLIGLLSDSHTETRYGAFRALVERHSTLPMVAGELLGGQCRYYTFNSDAPPLIHITHSRRPEIVLFSKDIRLTTPFSLDAGSLVVTSKGPDTVVVSKFVSQGVDETRMVSTRLDEILRAVVALGGTYPDLVQMFYDAEQQKVLPCRLEVGQLARGSRLPAPIVSKTDAVQEVAAKQSFWERMNPLRTTPSRTTDKKSHEKSIEANANSSARE
ncbi:MAG: flagellar basal body P-ring protein FlgI [Thermoguttaceae bacterium]